MLLCSLVFLYPYFYLLLPLKCPLTSDPPDPRLNPKTLLVTNYGLPATYLSLLRVPASFYGFGRLVFSYGLRVAPRLPPGPGTPPTCTYCPPTPLPYSTSAFFCYPSIYPYFPLCQMLSFSTLIVPSFMSFCYSDFRSYRGRKSAYFSRLLFCNTLRAYLHLFFL